MGSTVKAEEKIYNEAREQALKEASNHIPTPMVVVQRSSLFDDSSPIVKEYPPVMNGVCGFAWVNVKPGNSPFANWLKGKRLARRDDYYGGVTIWVSEFGQSYERKMKYAGKFAEVLQKYGIRALANVRLD